MSEAFLLPPCRQLGGSLPPLKIRSLRTGTTLSSGLPACSWILSASRAACSPNTGLSLMRQANVGGSHRVPDWKRCQPFPRSRRPPVTFVGR
jgi:hypothetical protein